ncbi:diguanylate cyclase [Thermodesulfobacteriota bacterium]
MTRILIAGLEAFCSVPVRERLEQQGYECVICSNLASAVSIILEDPPDLLVVEEGFDGQGDHKLVKASRACLQKANMPILLVISEDKLQEQDWKDFPVDDIVISPFSTEVLLARVALAEARMNRVFDNNPLTRLPGNTSILRAIQKTLLAGPEMSFGICYLDIDNFKPYNDRYGFSQGDEVIIMTARIIVNVIDELARDQSFVGHIGGDDFVFIVRDDKIALICEKILANFESVKNMFLSPADISAGGFTGMDRQGSENRFDLLSVSIAVISTGKGEYNHYGEVTAAASQFKSYVKKLEGSNYLIDRREKS